MKQLTLSVLALTCPFTLLATPVLGSETISIAKDGEQIELDLREDGRVRLRWKDTTRGSELTARGRARTDERLRLRDRARRRRAVIDVAGRLRSEAAIELAGTPTKGLLRHAGRSYRLWGLSGFDRPLTKLGVALRVRSFGPAKRRDGVYQLKVAAILTPPLQELSGVVRRRPRGVCVERSEGGWVYPTGPAAIFLSKAPTGSLVRLRGRMTHRLDANTRGFLLHAVAGRYGRGYRPVVLQQPLIAAWKNDLGLEFRPGLIRPGQLVWIWAHHRSNWAFVATSNGAGGVPWESLVPFASAAGDGWHAVLQRAGPSADRLDLVLVSEGYTAAQAAEFTKQCQTALGLFELEPFARYRRYFNVHAVFLPARGSGIGRKGEPDPGTVFQTRFRKESGTEITADIGRVQRRVLEALPGDVDADQIAVICNDTRHGGTAHGRQISFTTVTGFFHNLLTGSGLVKTLAHELGHTLGGLADEYGEREGFDLPKVRARLKRANYPNTVYLGPLEGRAPWSRWPQLHAKVPWAHWIQPKAVVPASLKSWTGLKQLAGFDHQRVGLYEGGTYSKDQVYRPSKSCRMRSSPHDQFCSPCQEALVLQLSSFVNPVAFDHALLGDRVHLSARSIVPRATRFVTWYTPRGSAALRDRLEEANRRGVFDLSLERGHLRGSSAIRVWVDDATPWVRRGRKSLRWDHEFAVKGLLTDSGQGLIDGVPQ